MNPKTLPVQSWPELVAALVKQSGIAIVFAGVIGFALSRVYSDLEDRNLALIALVREQVRESKAMTDSLVVVSTALDRNFRVLETLSPEIVKKP